MGDRPSERGTGAVNLTWSLGHKSLDLMKGNIDIVILY